MAKKCDSCSEVIKEDELGKLKGTIIKIKDSENRNEFRYLCSECQKQGKKI